MQQNYSAALPDSWLAMLLSVRCLAKTQLVPCNVGSLCTRLNIYFFHFLSLLSLSLHVYLSWYQFSQFRVSIPKICNLAVIKASNSAGTVSQHIHGFPVLSSCCICGRGNVLIITPIRYNNYTNTLINNYSALCRSYWERWRVSDRLSSLEKR